MVANSGLEITVIDLASDRDDGFIEVLVKASNGTHSASQQFYGQPDRFK